MNAQNQEVTKPSFDVSDVIELVANIVRVIWPIAPWLIITVYLAAQNEAAQAVWASWGTYRSLADELSQSSQVFAAIGLLLCSVSIYLGARGMLDLTLSQRILPSDHEEVLKSIPLVAVITFLVCFVVAGDRSSSAVSVVWVITVVHLVMRGVTLLRIVKEPSPVLAIVSLLSVAIVVSATRPYDSRCAQLGISVLIVSEALIGASSVGSAVKRRIYLALGLLAFVWIFWRGRELSKEYLGVSEVLAMTSAMVGIAIIYWAKGGLLKRIPLYFVAFVPLSIGLAIIYGVFRDGDWASRSLLCSAIIFSVMFCFLQLRADIRYSVDFYYILAAASLATLALLGYVISKDFIDVPKVGAIALMLTASALWGQLIVNGLILYVREGRRIRFLVTPIAVLLAIRAAWSPSPPELPNAPADERISLKESVEKKFGDKTGLGEGPYYVVAAEGGGLRAAIHTAVVLESLSSATCGEFDDRLLAISSVSGGSLGAAAFLNSPDRIQDRCSDVPVQSPDRGREPGPPASVRFVTNDFLVKMVGDMLFVAPFRFLIPNVLATDRGDILRKDWERTWTQTVGNNAFSMEYLKAPLASNDRAALFMNATSVSTGERVTIGTRRLDASEAVDLFTLSPESRQVSVADAALHSARFPIVTPPGPLWTNSPDMMSALTLLGNNWQNRVDVSSGDGIHKQFVVPRIRKLDHLVDGGYFDINGAETLLDVLDNLQAALPPGADLKVIVIHNHPVTPRSLVCDELGENSTSGRLSFLMNDGDGVEERGMMVRIDETTRPRPGQDTMFDGVLHPVSAFMNTRSARGKQALEKIRQRVTCTNISEAYFQSVPGFPSPPLTWHLDRTMIRRIQRSAGYFIDRAQERGVISIHAPPGPAPLPDSTGQ